MKAGKEKVRLDDIGSFRLSCLKGTESNFSFVNILRRTEICTYAEFRCTHLVLAEQSGVRKGRPRGERDLELLCPPAWLAVRPAEAATEQGVSPTQKTGELSSVPKRATIDVSLELSAPG